MLPFTLLFGAFMAITPLDGSTHRYSATSTAYHPECSWPSSALTELDRSSCLMGLHPKSLRGRLPSWERPRSYVGGCFLICSRLVWHHLALACNSPGHRAGYRQ